MLQSIPFAAPELSVVYLHNSMDRVIFDDIEISAPEGERGYILSGELGLVEEEEGGRVEGFSGIDVMIETVRRPLAQALPEEETLLKGGLERALEEAADQVLIRFREVRRVRLVLRRPGGPGGRAGLSISREWHTAYIGIGSNLGERAENIEKALELIDASRQSRVDEVSPLYETEPVGYLEQGKFLNGVCRIETLLRPRSLIRFLLEIESHLLRERSIPNGPRTIDLDVLFYDDIITSCEEAVIPHPRLHQRMFVLKPLTDLAPYLMHPVIGKRCYRLKEMLATEQPEPPVWEIVRRKA